MSIAPETVQRLTSAVVELVRTGRHVSARAAAQVYGDLPSFGWALLVPLERDGEQRTSALAAGAGIDVSVASRQIAVLERAGFVQRRPDPEDGRATLFRLTGAGADALAGSRALRASWAGSALADWDEDDGRLLADLLDRLVADLGRAARPPHAPRSVASVG
jgi:DNA-binding MarR family transcriptional regulator